MVAIGWLQREPPLAVAGVLVEGRGVSEYASLLAERIESVTDLRVVIGAELLIALSDEGALPWTDGAIWLGTDDGLLCPTHLAPDIPSGLVRKALSRGQSSSGVVVATRDMAIVAPSPARAPTFEQLQSLKPLAREGAP